MRSREPTEMQQEWELGMGNGNGSYQTEPGVFTLLLLLTFVSFLFFPLSAKNQ